MAENGADFSDRPTGFSDSSRRDFLGSCGSAAALACAATPALAGTQPLQRFEPSVLVDKDGAPIRPGALVAGKEYIFQYPFRATPCFLIDLGKPTAGGNELAQSNGDRYTWQGGAGPKKSIVAFSAICAHKLSHPSRVVSFIGYREYPVGFLNRETKEIEQRSGVIQCCSEHSIYDPAQGAQVMSGPAPQPLAAIALEVTDDALIAVGVYGGTMFASYFEKFGNRLMLEHRSKDYASPVGKTSQVVAGSDYTKNQMRCG